MPEIKSQIDKDAAAEFLHEIIRGWDDLPEEPIIELRCMFPERRTDISHFSPDSLGIDLLVDHAAAMNSHGLNTYPIINPVRASAVRGNIAATDADILAAFYFWADADDEVATYNIRNFAGPAYTMAVTTGRIPFVRPHIYWRMADGPMTDLARWTKIQKGIAAQLSTDKAVVNPSRVMRLPGMVNWPTKKKAKEKGRVPEISTLRTKYDDDRAPVLIERMDRIFGGPQALVSAAQSGEASFEIEDLPERVDAAQARAQALSGEEWHHAVVRLVASYVGRGFSDDEIHRQTDSLTLAGYTVEETRAEVQTAIDGARRKGWTPEKTEFQPNFDHTPAPTSSDPDPVETTWQVQHAHDFVADFVAPEYIIDGVVQRGRLYTFTAPTGSGKTAVMLYAATAISSGMQFCGLDVEKGSVLFLAGENPDDVRARMIGTLEHYSVDPTEIDMHFIAGTFSIRKDIERLAEEAEKLPNLVLVVVDTFAAYFDGEDENSNAQALDFARVIRSLTQLNSKPAVIMPAHPVKGAHRGNLAPKGGSSLVNEVDGNLTLWNADGLLSLHWQVKHRGPNFEPLTFELKRHESEHLLDKKGREMPTILAQPVLTSRAIEIARDTLSIEDQILLAIQEEPNATKRERAFTLGIPASRYQRIVERLFRQRLIRKFRTKWELTKDGERAVEEILSGETQPPDLDE